MIVCRQRKLFNFFDTVLHDVRYINHKAKNKKTHEFKIQLDGGKRDKRKEII